MKYDVARKLFNAIKNKSLHPDLILFDKNQHIGTILRKNKYK
jgi:hypothetical protein